MWPTLVKFGSFEITTFGLMMFIAFVVAGSLLTRQFRKYGLNEDVASSMVVAGAIGGILGAKIYYAILYGDVQLLFSRAGLVWYGGLIGGALACSALLLIKKIDFLTASDATAPALAIGYALGRVGCFLVGDDYGRPTSSAIGIAFPKGAPPTTAESLRSFGVSVDPSLPPDTLLKVHPTQLYEAIASLLTFAVLIWASRKPHKRGYVFGLFLVLAALERFLVEILRAKDDRFLGPFTVAQLISAILAVIGIVLLLRPARAEGNVAA